ncbi:unnamed protein product, partial [Chrysoparadoxa australica]
MEKEEITIDDLEWICRAELVESDQIEFKGGLSGKGGIDSWANGGNKVDDRAKEKIFSELIAFANTHGGWLFLGISESNDRPPLAAEITPLERCEELASKLSQISDSLIDPKIPNLNITTVVTSSYGKGVIVLSTGR